MSGERWIKVTDETRRMLDPHYVDDRAVADAFDAAEGQRVETIRWCRHNAPMVGDRCARMRFEPLTCFGECVSTAATLVIPPEASS